MKRDHADLRALVLFAGVWLPFAAFCVGALVGAVTVGL